MMLVRCRTGPSPIDGLGVFAGEPIATGQAVWRLDPDLDRVLPAETLIRMPVVQQEFFSRYAYFDEARGALVLCCDDARFMNHSPTPNVSSVHDDVCVALRDIAAGEELACNYHHLDPRPMQFQPRA